MYSTDSIKQYVREHFDEILKLHKELCLIPAPSHKEERRAAFCKEWFDKNCGAGAYIDEAKNVVFPYGSTEGKLLSVLCARTDTVFPDLELMPFIDDGRGYTAPVSALTAIRFRSWTRAPSLSRSGSSLLWVIWGS